MNHTPKHRHYFQISLTTLLWLMVVAAAFFAGWGVAERRAHRAIRQAREEFEAAARIAEESAWKEAGDMAAYARALAESYRKAEEDAERRALQAENRQRQNEAEALLKRHGESEALLKRQLNGFDANSTQAK